MNRVSIFLCLKNLQDLPIYQLFFLSLMVAAMWAYLYTQLLSQTMPQPASSNDLSSDYLINTEGCKIPETDPFNDDVSRMLRIRPSDLDCGRRPLLVQARRNTLYINHHSLRFYGYPNCFYQDINRKGDHSYTFGTEYLINDKAAVSADFVKVECRNDNDKVVYTDFFPFIQPKAKTEKRRSESTSNATETFRVICLGFDSVSRTHFRRQLDDVQKFLRKHVVVVELNGYNKLGENTYPNMVPFLTGKLDSEVPDPSTNPADDLPLVWQQFAKAGYRTLFSEDSPEMAIFNYAKLGFLEQPTDYYLRPFSLAVEESTLIKEGKLGCLNARIEASIILRWTADFLNTFPKDRLFTFTFLSRLTHDYFNGAGLLKTPILKFFRQLHIQGEFEKSIVFFFGDHGFRFGTFITTATGQAEDKLPFAFVILPQWFTKKYPMMYQNLLINKQRLTTPLDMYATLQTILHFDGQITNVTGNERSISLLSSQVPETRTCKDAAISTSFCSCLAQQLVPHDDQHVKNSAMIIIDAVNNLTQTERQKCAKLHLHRVLMSAVLLKRGETTNHTLGLKNPAYYITILVNPGLGIFDGTVLFNTMENTYSVDGKIGRINTYSNHSACIRTVTLKQFCYCIESSS